MLPAPPASVVAVGTIYYQKAQESSTNSFNLFVIVSLG